MFLDCLFFGWSVIIYYIYIVIAEVLVNRSVGWDKGMISSLLRVCWQSSNSVQQISMIHAASSSHEYLFSQNHASEHDSFK